MNLGTNLQFLRKRENMTQEQLAEALKVSRQSVSKWESDSTYPETDKLLQLTEMYIVTLKILDFTAFPQDSKLNLLPIYYF